MAKAVRLDKFLADAGAGTRSEVKKIIQKGQVQVNGSAIKKPEFKVNPDEDQVLLAGEEIGAAPEFVYYMLHKPAGFVSATEDNRDRTVMELVPAGRKGMFPVGRLDKDTEGLLLITDDGQLAHELLSPRKHVDKTYYAVVEGCVTEEDVRKIEEGVDIGEEKPTLPGKLEILSVKKRTDAFTETSPLLAGTQSPRPSAAADELMDRYVSEIRLTIHEGKFHQVKRMMEAVEKKVIYLKRLSMGSLTLPEDLKKGECRPLTEEEIDGLKSCGISRK